MGANVNTKKNAAALVATVGIFGLAGSMLASGACLATISSVTPRTGNRIECVVTCSGRFNAVLQGTTGPVLGTSISLPFEGVQTTFTLCGTGGSANSASNVCAGAMSSSCQAAALANRIAVAYPPAPGSHYMSTSVTDVSCTTVASAFTAGGCDQNNYGSCSFAAGSSKPGDPDSNSGSFGVGSAGYAMSSAQPPAIATIVPSRVRAMVNDTEASLQVEGGLTLSSTCKSCSASIVNMHLSAPPFSAGGIQVDDLHIDSRDAIPVVIDENGNFTVDTANSPLDGSFHTYLGWSHGAVRVSGIAGNVDVANRRISLNLRTAAVSLQQSTVTLSGRIVATY
jgi:hypothetical protein